MHSNTKSDKMVQGSLDLNDDVEDILAVLSILMSRNVSKVKVGFNILNFKNYLLRSNDRLSLSDFWAVRVSGTAPIIDTRRDVTSNE